MQAFEGARDKLKAKTQACGMHAAGLTGHTVNMDKRICRGWTKAANEGAIYECPKCGNHVCRDCAARNAFLCPHCFAGLCEES